jgi:hypothetical protein
MFMKADPAIEPHAEIRSDAGEFLAGGGFSRGKWVLVMGHRTMTRTESAGMMVAMLKHIASLQEQDGQSILLRYSKALRNAAADDASQHGMALRGIPGLPRSRARRP